jgi:hypothetical protein
MLEVLVMIVNIEKKEKVDIVTFTLRPEENTGSEILQWQTKFAKDDGTNLTENDEFLDIFTVSLKHNMDVPFVYNSVLHLCSPELYTKHTVHGIVLSFKCPVVNVRNR